MAPIFENRGLRVESEDNDVLKRPGAYPQPETLAVKQEVLIPPNHQGRRCKLIVAMRWSRVVGYLL
jgi:hypothetical protein